MKKLFIIIKNLFLSYLIIGLILGTAIIIREFVYPIPYSIIPGTFWGRLVSIPWIAVMYGWAIGTSLYGYIANIPTWITLKLPYCIAFLAAILVVFVLLCIKDFRKKAK